MDEKRKSGRLKAEDYLRPIGRKGKPFIQVGSRQDGAVVGHIVDFSLTGMKLVSDNYFDIDRVYQMRAEFPVKGQPSAIVTFDAKCIWCARREDDDLYDTGFQFHKLTEEESTRLRTLLRQSSSTSPK